MKAFFAKYRGIIIVLIPALVVAMVLVWRPDVLTTYPYVFIGMLIVGIIVGVLLVRRR